MTSPSKTYIVQSFGRNGAVEDIFNVESGAADPKVISAKQRGRIKILGDTDGSGPGTLNVKRSGSDLQVFMDTDASTPDMVLADYFEQCADGTPGSTACSINGTDANGKAQEYVAPGKSSSDVGFLSDGAFAQLSTTAFLNTTTAGPLPANGAPTAGDGHDLAVGAGLMGAAAAAMFATSSNIGSNGGSASGSTGGGRVGALATTAAGSSPAAPTVTDDVAYFTGNVADNALTNDARPTFSGGQGSVPAGSTVDVTITWGKVGSKTFSVTAGGDGSWSVTPTENLLQGLYTVTYTSTDSGGVSAPSAPTHFLLDTEPPEPGTATAYDQLLPVVGDVPVVGGVAHTNDPFVGLRIATLNDGETPYLVVDGAPVESTYDAATHLLVPKVALAPGEHQLAYRIQDAAGNRGRASDALTVDVQTPADRPDVGTLYDDVDPYVGRLADHDSTNDTRPTYTLTVRPADDVTPVLYIDGAVASDAVYDRATQTFSLGSPLSQGDHTFSHTLRNLAQVESAPSDRVTITVDTGAPTALATIVGVEDDVAPVVGNVAAGGYSNDTTPRLTGTLSQPLNPGETVVVLDATGNRRLGVATVSSDGLHWQFQSPTLDEGDHTFRVHVEDSAHNVGATSADYLLHIDLTAPDTPAAGHLFDDQEPHVGRLQNEEVSNDRTPVYTLGTRPAEGLTPTLYVDGYPVSDAVYDPVTQQFTLVTPLGEGRHGFGYSLKDAAGNESGLSPLSTLIVDSVAPTSVATIDNVYDDAAPSTGNVPSAGYTNDVTPLLRGTLTQPLAAGEKLVIHDNAGSEPLGIATISGDGLHWEFQATTLPAGEHSFRAIVVDAAFNSGASSAPYLVHIDLDVPGTPRAGVLSDDKQPHVGPLANGDHTNDDTPVYTLVDAPAAGQTPILYIDGARATDAVYHPDTLSFTLTTGLSDGPHTFGYTLASPAQIEGPRSADIGITVDTAAPTAVATITGAYDDVEGFVQNIVSGGLTNDAQPRLSGTITGTLSPTDRVFVYDGDVLLGQATVDAAGTTWTLDVGTPLLHGGSNLLRAAVRDLAYNESDDNLRYELRLDLDPPTTTAPITSVLDDDLLSPGSIAPGQATNDTTPKLSGTFSGPVAETDTVLVYDQRGLLGTATISADRTSWSLTVGPLAAGDGPYVFHTEVRDGAGNHGPKSADYGILLDTTAPTTTVTIVDAYDDVPLNVGALRSGDHTNDATPQLRGVLSAPLAAGESLVIYDGATPIGTARVDGTNWTFDTAALGTAVHTFMARVEDAAHNLGAASSLFSLDVDLRVPSTSVSIDAIVDSDRPVASSNLLLLPEAARQTHDTTLALSGTLSASLAAGDVVRLYDGDTPLGLATVTGTAWTFSTVGLVEGDHHLQARVESAVGNQGTPSASYLVTLDLTAPTATAPITGVQDDVGAVQGNVASDGYTDDATPVLSGTIDGVLAAGDKVIVYNGDVPLGEAVLDATRTHWSLSVDIPLHEGLNELHTRVVDAALNAGPQSARYSVNLDTVMPVQPLAGTLFDDADPYQGQLFDGDSTNDPTPIYRLSVAPPAGETPVLLVNGQAVPQAVFDPSTLAFTLPAGVLGVDGDYAFAYKLVDRAGVSSAPSDAIHVSLDTTPPTTTVAITTAYDSELPSQGLVASGGSTNDTTPELRGTVSAPLVNGERVALYADGGTTPIGYASVTGTDWTFTPTLSTGSHTLKAVVVDKASLKGAESAPFSLDVASAPPDRPAPPTDVIDDVPSVVGSVPAHGGLTDDRRPGLVIPTVPAGTTPVLLVDGVPVEATFANQQLVPKADLAVGHHSLSYALANAAGLTSEPSTSIGIDVDPSIYLKDVAANLGGFVIQGAHAGDMTGMSVAAAGDVNGDGFDDLLIGAPNANKAYVVFGKEAPASGTPSTIDLAAVERGVGGFVINGKTTGDRAGFSVSAAGDLNGDGLADILVGAPGADQTGKASGSVTPPATVSYTVTTQGIGLHEAGIKMEQWGTGDVGADWENPTGAGWKGTPNVRAYKVFVGGVAITNPSTGQIGFSYLEGHAYMTLWTMQHMPNQEIAVQLSEFKWNSNLKTREIDTYMVYKTPQTTTFNNLQPGTSYTLGIPGSNLPAGLDGTTPTLPGNLPPTNLAGYQSGTGWESVFKTWTPELIAAFKPYLDQYKQYFSTLPPEEKVTFTTPPAPPNPDITFNDVGATYVVNGKSDTGPVSLANVEQGIGGFVVKGQHVASAQQAGFSVSSAGDVNGDGLQDLIIGAPNTGGEKGASYVVLGTRGAQSVDIDAIVAGTSSRGFVIKGSDGGAQVGYSVTAAGDVNGDGLDDLFVGGPSFGAGTGRGYLVFGKAGSASVDLANVVNGIGGFVINGEATGQASSVSASGAGDVNGDGLDDLLIGAPTASGGKAYVLFGRTGHDAVNLSAVAAGNGQGFAIQGSASGDDTGMSVSKAGDINGDGLQDVIVGARNADGSAGRTYVVFGKTDGKTVDLADVAAGRGGFAIKGEAGTDMSGYAVAGGGDINGDGIDDLIVSAPHADTTAGADAGKTYVIYGSKDGGAFASVIDQAGGAGAQTLTGTSADDSMIGGTGADTLIGHGGADVMYGGAGNDTFRLDADNVAQLSLGVVRGQLAKVEGGTGIDTLALDGAAITLDLSAIATHGERIASIERIDLTGSGDNTLRLTVADVLDIAGQNSFNASSFNGLAATQSQHQLVVDGNAGDKLFAGNGWTLSATTVTSDSHVYHVYNAGAAQLLVDERIQVVA